MQKERSYTASCLCVHGWHAFFKASAALSVSPTSVSLPVGALPPSEARCFFLPIGPMAHWSASQSFVHTRAQPGEPGGRWCLGRRWEGSFTSPVSGACWWQLPLAGRVSRSHGGVQGWSRRVPCGGEGPDSPGFSSPLRPSPPHPRRTEGKGAWGDWAWRG